MLHDKAKHMHKTAIKTLLPTLINTHYTNTVVKQPTTIPFTVLRKPSLPPPLHASKQAGGGGLEPTRPPPLSKTHFTSFNRSSPASHTCTDLPAVTCSSSTPTLRHVSPMGTAGKAENTKIHGSKHGRPSTTKAN